MAPKRKAPSPSAPEDLVDTGPPTSIDPYATLSLPTTATPQEITRAYRLSALRFHPDKAPSASDRETYTKKFQDIAFAYAVLSDPRRRERYDRTGNTSESLDLNDDDFDWSSYFRERYSETLSADAIEKFKREYQGSDEERADVLAAYSASRGDLDRVFETVMCSSVLDDEDRFRAMIDAAIAAGDVKKEKKYSADPKAREKRKRAAEAEAREAEELADELGVRDKLYGDRNNKKKSKKGDADQENGLMALIQSRQKERQGRQDDFFARLEEKYGGGGGSGGGGAGKKSKKQKKGKRIEEEDDDDDDDDDADSADDEPSEEAFQATQARLEKNRVAAAKKKKGKGK